MTLKTTKTHDKFLLCYGVIPWPIWR